MNRRLLIIVCLLLVAFSANAQKSKKASSKTPAVPVLEQVQQAMDAYDFAKAEELLNKEIAATKKKRKSTMQLDELLRLAQRRRAKLRATERITIIDSLVCQKDEALRAIKISKESGRLLQYSNAFGAVDSLGCIVYENSFGNKRYLAVPQEGYITKLAYSDKIGDTWAEPQWLSGLGDEGIQNFPFLLSDGVTLYYASTGSESLGGYDIFVTRADGESGQFLTPENVGFPFNSSANDYMLAIDELNQLGWFITDRRQPEGLVCIYIFIPNDTREVYDADIEEEQLRSLARITSISETWRGNEQKALNRLAAVRSGGDNSLQPSAADFHFVIDDTRTYTRLTDFHSPTAREKMQQWMQLSKNVNTDETILQRMRDNYATASASERMQLATSIKRLESSYYAQVKQLNQLAKEIRNAEISFK